jgi:hypothetical protein
VIWKQGSDLHHHSRAPSEGLGSIKRHMQSRQHEGRTRRARPFDLSLLSHRSFGNNQIHQTDRLADVFLRWAGEHMISSSDSTSQQITFPLESPKSLSLRRRRNIYNKLTRSGWTSCICDILEDGSHIDVTSSNTLFRYRPTNRTTLQPWSLSIIRTACSVTSETTYMRCSMSTLG